MPRMTSNTTGGRRRTDALLGDDVLIPQQSRYKAVINPTDTVVQAWAYGRRAVLVPNELSNPKRACIQFIDAKIAAKMVYNNRRLLEILSYDQGVRLLRKAREVGDFYAAYSELTGRSLSKTAQTIRRQRTLVTLRRQLDALGIPVKRQWDADTMRAVLKRPELAFEMDAGEAPSDADDIHDFLPADKPKRFVDRGSVPESGLAGDFIEPETLEDGDEPPERVMAGALLREEHGEDPFVAAEARAREVTAAAETRVRGEVKDIDEVRARAQRHQADTDEAQELRDQLKVLGVKVHPRTRKVEKLREMLRDAKAEAATG